MRPTRTESERRKPLANTWQSRQARSVTVPTIQLFMLPKSGAPIPPANELAPMGRSEKPIAVTTVAETTCGMSLIQYLTKSPSSPSTRPPTMTAPISVPIPYVPAMPMASERNVNEMPMTIGRREPMRHTGKSCTRVPIPAITIQFCMSAALTALSSPTAAARIMIGVMLLTNMASTCCRPNGRAFPNGTLPSSR